MTQPIDWKTIAQRIGQSINQTIGQSARDVELSSIASVSGGDIHAAWQVQDIVNHLSYFVKTNTVDALPVLQAEAQSLNAIAAVNSIKTPRVICCDSTDTHSFLVLEYLSFDHQADEYLLGQRLAEFHRVSVNRTQTPYGFTCDNFIGLTPQKNTQSDNWKDFWIQQRIMPQFELAFANGFVKELKPLLPSLLTTIDSLLGGYQPPAVLLHGDLWSGNKGFANNQPVIFDPACYYGDRETDIAMTELFGGFSTEFYRGYKSIWPLDEAYKQRKSLYNLYHVLNHLNLFGGGYLSQVKAVCQCIV